MPDEQIKKAVEDAPEAFEDSAVIEAMLVELAALPIIEYEQRRKEAKKRLGVRYSVLDAEVAKRRPTAKSSTDTPALFADTELWPEAVDGAALLGALTTAVARYVVLPEGAATAIALWVIHAHAHDAAQISPILAIESPIKRCGKSTLQTILKFLTPRPLATINITVAPLFRAVEKWKPTVLLDEAETFLRDDDALRGLLNAGHNRAGAFVIRAVGDDHDPTPFSVWAPKSIALIGKLPDTLADRSITIRLNRRRRDETIERQRLDRMEGFVALAQQTARWAADNMDALREADPEVPAELHDRAADNWRPLLAVADHSCGQWPEWARQAARLLSDVEDEDSAAVMLLADIHALFTERGSDRITSVDLARALGAMEERPWPEWRKGNPITARSVARLLAGFFIKPRPLRIDGQSVAKGYLLDDFKDIFPRYVPDLSVTRLQPNETGPSSENASVTPEKNVTDEKGPKPAEINECNRVTDEKGGAGEKWGMEI